MAIIFDLGSTTNHDNQNAVPAINTTIAEGSVIDDTGAVVSGVSFAITSPFNGAEVSGGGTAFAEVINTTEQSYLSLSPALASATMVISGLVAGTYDVDLFGARNSAGSKPATMAINGQAAKSYNADPAGNYAAHVASDTVTISGGQNISIVVAHATGAAYAYANQLTISAAAGPDTTPPTFTAGPAITDTTATGHTITATISEAGNLYAVRLMNGATAPSAMQVFLGLDAGDMGALEWGCVAAAAGVPAALVFSTASPNTPYDYYVVAEDALLNLQAAPVFLEGTTLSTTYITSVNSGNPIANGQTNVAVVWNAGATGTTAATINGVAQTGYNVTNNTNSDFDAVLGSNRYGVNYTLNINGTQFTVSYEPASTEDFIDLTNISNSDVTAIPALAISDQIEYKNTTSPSGYAVAIDANGQITITGGDPAGESFDVRVNDGTGWGNWATQTITVASAPPVITGNASHGVAENTAFQYDFTITELDGETPTLSGPDAALFSLTAQGGNVWRLSLPARNYETPTDANSDNIYQVTLNADDTGNPVVTLDIDVTVSNALEVVITPPANTTLEFSGAGLAHNDAALLAWLATAVNATSNNLGSFADPIPAGVHVFTFDAPDASQQTAALTAVASVSITSVNGGNPIANGQNNVPVVWHAGATGTTAATINGVAQTGYNVTNDTNCDFDAVLGSNRYGVNYTLDINGTQFTVAYVPAATEDFIDLTNISNSDVTAIPALAISDQIEYKNTTSPSGYAVAIDANGQITITSGDPAGESFDVRVNDGTGWGNWATQTITVASAPPVIAGNASHVVAENTVFQYDFTITELDGETPTLSGPDAALFSLAAQGGNVWRLSLAARNYEVPTDENSDNIYQVTLNADDTVNPAVTLDVDVTVSNVLEVVITPPVDTTLEFAFSGAGLAHNNSALIAWLATATNATSNNLGTFADPIPSGVHVFTFDAADASQQTATLTVAESAANDPPVIAGNASHVVAENTAFQYDFTITELDGHTPTISGPDAALFSLAAQGGNVWRLSLPARNYEAPTDADSDNLYLVTLNADDTVNPAVTLNVDVTVSNVLEVIITPPANTAIEYAFGGAGLAHNNAALLAWLATAVNATGNNLSSFANPIPAGTHVFTFDAPDSPQQQTATLTVAEAVKIVSVTGGEVEVYTEDHGFVLGIPAAISLTGATSVRLLINRPGGSKRYYDFNPVEFSSVDVGGTLRYNVRAGDLTVPGEYWFQIIAKDTGSDTAFRPFRLTVAPRIHRNSWGV